MLSHAEILRYSRHLLLPEVGLEGQQKLKKASALVVGAGGLGSPVALYLAAAGVGHIGLVDGDVVDASNLQRQVIHGEAELGQPKAESARRRLVDINPYIEVIPYAEPFTSANAMRIAEPYDVILDCSDNFPTRYLVNDLCVLTGKPDVFGAIYRFDGQMSVFDARQGPCYRCLFPAPPPPNQVPTCAEGGVLGVLPGVIGTLQANEALKLLLGIGEPLTGRLLLYNALDLSFEFVRLRKHAHCLACGDQPSLTGLVDYEAFCGLSGAESGASASGEISPQELAARLEQGIPPCLVDVREPHELAISQLPGAQNLPLGELAARLSELDAGQEIVLFCRSGVRSARALELLQAAGFHHARHLQGGINAWARDVDPQLAVY